MGFKPKENTGQRISQQQEMVFSREQLVLIRGTNLSLIAMPRDFIPWHHRCVFYLMLIKSLSGYIWATVV